MKWIILGLISLFVLAGFTAAGLFLWTLTGPPVPPPTSAPRLTPTETRLPTPTPQPTPTPTLVLIPTPTPLPTPRLPTTETQDGPPRVSDVRVSGGPFYPYDRERKCPQNALVVRARITDANGIAEAVVAYRLVTTTNDRVTEYSFVSMTYIGEDTYVQTFLPFARTGYFEYGVLARDQQGEVGRTGFVLPVEIQPCLIFAVPTFALPTPRR